MDKQAKLAWISLIVLTGFIIAVLFHVFVSTYTHHAWNYPLNTFLFNQRGIGWFSDFYPNYNASQFLSPYAKEPFLDANYLPFTYLLFHVFNFLDPQTALFLFLYFYLFSMAVFNFYFLNVGDRITDLRNVIIFTLTTYPVLFALERANAEILVFIFLCLGLLFYSRRLWLWSACFIAVAAAIKAYPSVFLLLFVYDKHPRYFGVGLSIIAGLTLLSLCLFHPDLITQLKVFESNLIYMKHVSLQGNNALMNDSGLFACLKLIFHLYHHVPFSSTVPTPNFKITEYTFGALMIFLGVVVFLWKIPTELWEKISLLSAAIILLPHFGADYKLLYVYLMLYFFVNAPPHPKKIDFMVAVLIGILLIPKKYFLIYGPVSIENPMNALLLLCVLFLPMTRIPREVF